MLTHWQKSIIVTLSILLTGPVYASSGLTCDLAFVKPKLSSSDLPRVTQELAELIHQLEASPHTSAQKALLRKTIAKKLNELYQHQDPTNQLESFKVKVQEQIKQHLEELKHRDSLEQGRSQKGVELVKNENWVKPPLFKLIGSQVIPDYSTSVKFEYLEKSNSMLLEGIKQDFIFDLNSGEKRDLPFDFKIQKVIGDGELSIIVDYNWQIKLVHTTTGIVQKIVEPELKEFMSKIDGADFDQVALSPNQKFVALGGWHGKIVVIDFDTGKVIGESSNQAGTISSWIKLVEFTSNSEVIFNGDSIVKVYDFINNTNRDAKLNNKGALFGAALSADRSLVSVATFNEVISYSTKDLEKVVSRAPIYSGRPDGNQSVGSQTSVMKALPGDIGHIAMVGNGTAKDFGIFSSHQLDSRVFDFADAYNSIGEQSIKNISFSLDKSKMFVLVVHEGQGRIDIWKLR